MDARMGKPDPYDYPDDDAFSFREASGKLRAARGNDRLILGGGLLLIVSAFLPWKGAVIGDFVGELQRSGLRSGIGAFLGILLGLFAVAMTVARILDVEMDLGVDEKLVQLGLAAGAVFFVAIRILIGLGTTKYGALVALAACVTILVGAFRQRAAG